MNTRQPHVLVAGSGITGLTLALCLRIASPRVRVTVCDPRPAPPMPESPGLRVAAMTPASIAVFETLGVWSQLPAFAVAPYTRMQVWDAADAPGAGIEFAAARFGLSALGAIVDNDALVAALMQRVAADPGIHKESAGVTDIEPTPECVLVTLDNGRQVPASLVVGADGRSSQVRELAGIVVRAWSHHQQAIVAHLRPELDARHTALQRFLGTGPLALLPLADGRVSLVWSTDDAAARELLALDDAAFEAAVTAASDQVLGHLSLTSRRVTFPLASAFAEDPVATRTVLVGDAAHSIHPLAGQGANLGIADAVALAVAVRDAVQRGADVGDPPVLRRYRRARRADNLSTLYGMDFINRLFAREQGWLATLRRHGMHWFARSDLARQLAIGHATALRGGAGLEGIAR